MVKGPKGMLGMLRGRWLGSEESFVGTLDMLELDEEASSKLDVLLLLC